MTSVKRLSVTTALVLLALSARALAQAPENVTIGVVTFLQYAAELHEQDGYNAFDVTRGYVNIQARLTDRLQLRFTPGGRLPLSRLRATRPAPR